LCSSQAGLPAASDGASRRKLLETIGVGQIT
jgi:hypothetical protein